MPYIGNGGAVGAGNDLLDPGLHDDPILGDVPSGMSTRFRLGGVSKTANYGSCQLVEDSNNATVSSEQATGYATSLKFTAQAQIRYQAASCLYLGTGDFSIKGKTWIDSSSTRILLWGWYVSSATPSATADYLRIQRESNGTINAYINGVSRISFAGANNAWVEWEFRRIGNTLTGYKDGVSQGTFDVTGYNFTGSTNPSTPSGTQGIWGMGFITSEGNTQEWYCAALRIAMAV